MTSVGSNWSRHYDYRASYGTGTPMFSAFTSPGSSNPRPCELADALDPDAKFRNDWLKRFVF